MLSLRSPPWRRNPSKPASGKPGAVQPAVIGVEQDLLSQQDASDPEQPVSDATQRATIGVATRTQGLVAAAALWVVHGGDTGPVEHRLA